MRSEPMIALQWFAALAIALSAAYSTVAAEPPASAAQQAAWRSQKEALEAQQKSAWSAREALQAEKASLQAQVDALVAEENFYANLQKNEVALAAQAKIQGVNPGVLLIDVMARNVDARNKRNELRAKLAKINADDARLAQAITTRDAQIAQLERTMTYYANPRQGDLKNEQTRLRTLNRQNPTSDDQGQLNNDKKNTQNRINQLENEFQSSGSGRGTTTAQPQPPTYQGTSPPPPPGPQSALPGSPGGPASLGAAGAGVITAPPKPGNTAQAGNSVPGAPTKPTTTAATNTPTKGGACDAPLCRELSQLNCQSLNSAVGTCNESASLPSCPRSNYTLAEIKAACFQNMSTRCVQGMGGATGGTCVRAASGMTCEAHAMRVCGCDPQAHPNCGGKW